MSQFIKQPKLQNRSAEIGQAFAKCLAEIKSGPWKFIQLRGETFAADNLTDDDIDLLGTRESVHLLLKTCFEWVRAGRCHMRIRSRKENKVEFTLFSLDGRQSALFDLWTNLPQLDRGRSSLTYEACQTAVIDSNESIQRLPFEIEACVYIQHLICKKKNLNTPSVQHRLTNYFQRFLESRNVELRDVVSSILLNETLSPTAEQISLEHLNKTLNKSHLKRNQQQTSTIFAKLQAAGIGTPRHSSMVTMIGCDGAGKTTLAHELKKHDTKIGRIKTGKHFYRKSLSYKLAVIFIRPLLFQDRERFDEILAPFVYLRACLGLRLMLLFSSKNNSTLIDRSLIDFLYVDRKTDAPRFSKFYWLRNLFGVRIPNVHCIASHETVMQRKQEVTRQGHFRYDEDMFQEFALRCPTDAVLFNNDGELDASRIAIQRILSKSGVCTVLNDTAEHVAQHKNRNAA